MVLVSGYQQILCNEYDGRPPLKSERYPKEEMPGMEIGNFKENKQSCGYFQLLCIVLVMIYLGASGIALSLDLLNTSN